jgi:hypothetical protein
LAAPRGIEAYVRQLAPLLKPREGRAFVGAFSDKNPDPWTNPRRLSEGRLRALFCAANGWDVVSVEETWWQRPSRRGSAAGAWSLALWLEARRCDDDGR